MKPPKPLGLSPREVEIMRLVAEGMETKEIARALNISPATVNNQVQTAKTKIGISDRWAAAQILRRHLESSDDRLTNEPQTLSKMGESLPFDAVSNQGARQPDSIVDTLSKENVAFVTSVRDWPEPSPDQGRRNQHDTYERISMLLVRTVLLLAATVALLWVYGRH
jgi:DNA-binding CsgD family transcriptional regulator